MQKNQWLTILQSFLPLIAFYGFEHFYGLKVAIGATVVVAVLEFIYRKLIKKEELGGFFYFVTGMTIIFGLIDVLSANTSFFKYEPSITNLVTGIYFAWGTMKPKPLILEFAEKAGSVPNPVPEVLVAFMRVMSWMWVAYFMVKGLVYLWLAGQPETSTSKMMIIRTVAGNASMFVMLGISWLLGKPIMRWVRKSITARKPH